MRERWPLEGDVLETRQIDHAGLDAKELIWHCHENANKWIVDDGVFDVKTMDELVAEANTDRLEREGGRRSFIVDFHSASERSSDARGPRGSAPGSWGLGRPQKLDAVAGLGAEPRKIWPFFACHLIKVLKIDTN